MSSIFYGTVNRAGNPISGVLLDVFRTEVFDVQPVVDQRGNYVYSDYVLIVKAVLSRTVHPYRMIGGGRGFAPARPGRVSSVTGGAETAEAVRHYLSAPRRYLKYTVGRTTLLESFTPGSVSDIGAGPTPLNVLRVDEVIGGGALHVTCGWRGKIRENTATLRGLSRGLVSPLISHTMEQSEVIDPDGYSTITTRGKAVFRSDVMERENLIPDDFRSWLIVPVHDRCRRQHVRVVATESGSELMYEVVDKEVFVRIVNQDISRVEGTHTVVIVQPSNEQRAVSTASWGWSTGMSLVPGGQWLFGGGGGTSGFFQARPGNTAPAASGGPGMGGLQALPGSTYSWISGMTPQVEHRIVVRVWGRSDSEHQFLSRNAHVVLGSRLPGVNPNRSSNVYSSVLIESRDLSGAFVELNATLSAGAFGGLFGLQLPGGVLPSLEQFFPPETVAPNARGVMRNNRGVGQAMLNSNGTRGNTVGNVVAQALLDQDQLPAQPAYRRQFDARNPYRDN